MIIPWYCTSIMKNEMITNMNPQSRLSEQRHSRVCTLDFSIALSNVSTYCIKNDPGLVCVECTGDVHNIILP